ncbi:MAG: hypothetical protein HRU15_18700, partial [Planctomycetes bacterium]|nr:hypothetical protein [Planctomycetota bacterium]
GHIHRRIRGQAVFSTFYATGDNAALTIPNAVTCLNTEPSPYMAFQREACSLHEIKTQSGISFTIAAAPFDTNIKHADISSDADLVIVVRNKQGKVIDWGMAGGRRIQSHDLDIQKRKACAWEHMK